MKKFKEGDIVGKKVKTRDRITIIRALIWGLVLVTIVVVLIIYANFSLTANLDVATYRHLENNIDSRQRSVNIFAENHFNLLRAMINYIDEKGEDAFCENISEMYIDSNDLVILGLSDADGNTVCSVYDETISIKDVFPESDQALKYGHKMINMVNKDIEDNALGFVMPIFKNRRVTGAAFLGAKKEKVEEAIESNEFNNSIVVFITDSDGDIIFGNKKFNSIKGADNITEYFNGDSDTDKLLSDIKNRKAGKCKAFHDETTYVVYSPLNINQYSIFVSVGKTAAYKNIVESQKRYQYLAALIIIVIIVQTAFSLLMLTRNARRIIKASNVEISKNQYKNEIYRDAILTNCLGFVEANVTDGIVIDMSEIRYVSENLPDELRVAPDKIVKFDDLMLWISENTSVPNRERYDLVNNSEYLLSRYNNGERMVEFFFSTNVSSKLRCRTMFYLYEDKFDHKVHAFCIVHDVTETHKNEKEIKELTGELREAKIKNSTSQMQPHFLYNALASIREIILEDPQYASDLVYDFTKYLRACIRSMSNDNFVSFDQELENIKAYVNIEKMRFGDKLRIETDIGVSDFKIVPLSIQPLVENAIRHGIYHRGSAGGTVTVKTFEEDGNVVIQVIDDGVGFDYKKVEEEIKTGKRDSSGIENIKFRLEKMMKATVEIESEPNKGTVVTVRTNVTGGTNNL